MRSRQSRCGLRVKSNKIIVLRGKIIMEKEKIDEEVIKHKVAKEIFNDLNEYLKTWRAENQRKIQYNQPEYYKGKIVAADEVSWFIRTELKKKYLREEL